MQTLTDIETLAEPKLVATYGAADGKALWGEYVQARQKAVHEILPHIARTEPYLTDYGPEHIRNVFDNAFLLPSSKGCTGKDSKTALNANERYFLSLAILLHDLGNIHGRKEHNRHLEESCKSARGSDPRLLPEKRLLFAIVEAHCGQTREGHETPSEAWIRQTRFGKTGWTPGELLLY